MTCLEQIRASRIIVTGGNGLIGRATVEHLANLGAEVTIFARPESSSAWMDESLADKVSVVAGDVMDVESLRLAFRGQDAVVHMGGYAGLGMASVAETYQVNVAGTFNVFIEAVKAGVTKLVYASSINANGFPLGALRSNPPALPYDEYAEAVISDEYSLSKQASENAAQMVSRITDMGITGLRFPLTRDITLDGGRVFGEDVLRRMQTDPRRQAAEGWSYLDIRDAARSVELALLNETPAAPGILVAAPDTYLKNPTGQAHLRYFPEVPTAGFEGRQVGLNLRLQKEWLNFHAEICFEDFAREWLVDLDDLPSVDDY